MMASRDQKVEALTQCVLELQQIVGRLSAEVMELRAEPSSAPEQVPVLGSLVEAVTPTKTKTVSAKFDVLVEEAVDSSKIDILYCRWVERSETEGTLHIVGLGQDEHGLLSPLGVRTIYHDVDDVSDIQLIEATPDRLERVGWTLRGGKVRWKKVE